MKSKIWNFENYRNSFWNLRVFEIPDFWNVKINFWNLKIYKFRFRKKYILKKCFYIFLFFIKIMLIRFSLLSSNPIALLGSVHLLSDTEPKIEKSWKSSLFRRFCVQFEHFCISALVKQWRVALIPSHTAQFDTGSDLGQTCPAPSLARLPLTFTVSGSDLSWKRVSSQSDVYSKIYRLFKVE